MDFVRLADTRQEGWLWAASIARSLLAPQELTRTVWRGERHECMLWWGPITIAEPGDVMYSFKSQYGHCIERVRRPPPPIVLPVPIVQ